MRDRLLARADHLAEGRGHAEHLVVVAVPEIALDRRRELVALLLEEHCRVAILPRLVGPAEPNLRRHPVLVGDEGVAGRFARVHAHRLDAGAEECHHRPRGMLAVDHPAVGRVAALDAGDDVLDRAELARVALAEGGLHAPLVAEQARRHQRCLVFAGELQDLPRPGDGLADGLVAEGRQPLAQAGRDEVEVVVAVTGGVAEPDGIDVIDQLVQRLRRLHAGEGLEVRAGHLGVGVVEVRDLRVGEGKLVEVEARIARDLAEHLGGAGVEVLLGGVEIDGGVEVLGEVPGVAVARLRLAPDAGGDDADAVDLGGEGGIGTDGERCRRRTEEEIAAGGRHGTAPRLVRPVGRWIESAYSAIGRLAAMAASAATFRAWRAVSFRLWLVISLLILRNSALAFLASRCSAPSSSEMYFSS